MIEVALLLSTVSWSDTYHVSTTGSDTEERDGRSPETAWKSLAYACERVPAGDHTIRLSAGTFAARKTAQPKSGLSIVGAGSRATRLVDRGVNVGLPFNGEAPDIGADEFGEERPLIDIPGGKR